MFFRVTSFRKHVEIKILYCNTHDTGACSSSEIERNRNRRKKEFLTKTKCFKASKFLWNNDLVKSLFCHETNFY